MKLPNKLHDENLDYRFDFAKRMDTADTITSSTATVATGDVVVGSVTHTDTAVTFWLSGGTSGKVCEVLVEAVTTGGRTFAEPAIVQIVG